MKLKHLVMKDFLNHEHTALDLSKAIVHVFVGQNSAGKSALRDAIAWVLTGKCRGLKTQNEQSALIKHGASKTEVRVLVDDVEIIRRKTLSTFTWQIKRDGQIYKNPAEALGISEEILELLMDASAFFILDEQKQKTILHKLLHLEIDRGDLVTELKKQGIGDNITEKFADIALSRGFDQAQQEAIMERRATKRTLQNLSPFFVSPTEVVEINGKQYRLAEISKSEVIQGLNSLKAQREKLIEEKGRISVVADAQMKEILKRRLDSLYEEKRFYEALPSKQEIQTDLAEIRKKIEQKISLKESASSRLASLQAEMARITSTADNTPDACPVFLNFGVEKVCPLSNELAQLQERLIAKTGELNAEIEKLSSEVENIEKELNDLRTTEAELQVKLKAAEKKEKGLKEIEAKISVITRELNQIFQEDQNNTKARLKEINQKIAELSKRIDTGEKLLKAIEVFGVDFKKYREALRQKEILERQIEIYDRLAALLAPDGLIKEFTASALKPLNERLAHTGNFWRMKVHFDPDLNVFVNNMPYNLVSESERFRAGILIQEAMAHFSGARFFMIDRADMLDPDNRALLLSLLYQVRNDYDTVFVFSTVSEVTVKPSPVPEIQMWWVGDGKVEAVTEPMSREKIKKAA